MQVGSNIVGNLWVQVPGVIDANGIARVPPQITASGAAADYCGYIEQLLERIDTAVPNGVFIATCCDNQYAVYYDLCDAGVALEFVPLVSRVRG